MKIYLFFGLLMMKFVRNWFVNVVCLTAMW